MPCRSNVATPDPAGYPNPGGEMRFTVMGAASQERVGGPLQVLLLQAAWHKGAHEWRRFLGQIAVGCASTKSCRRAGGSEPC